jgi:iron(III) transport system ATP-binding protein
MLKVENLEMRYATVAGEPQGGIFGASFELAPGELFTLLGPSGCGKSTTLRSIAGLETPQRGVIALDGIDLFNAATGTIMPMYDRDIGMVFQSYAIWPHMSVFENAAYPLRVARENKPARSEIVERVTRVLSMVGLDQFKSRSATQLSGGQQQRLALARALVREPKLLLLDEPLSNLDAQLREQMRSELKRIQAEWGVTTLYVTHDQTEAMAISDRIAVLDQGRIMQVGSPAEIYEEPHSEFVANFIGRTNMLRGVLCQGVAGGEFGVIDTPVGPVRCRFPKACPAGAAVTFVVRPENIELSPSGAAATAENVFEGRIVSQVYLGEAAEYVVAVNAGIELFAKTAAGLPLSVGDLVRTVMPAAKTVAVQAA